MIKLCGHMHAFARGPGACSRHEELKLKIIHSGNASEAVFGYKYHSSDLPVSSLHVRMKLAIAHANIELIFDLSFLHYFTRAPANFTWAQPRVCPGVATPLVGKSVIINSTCHVLASCYCICILAYKSHTEFVIIRGENGMAILVK